MAEYYTDSQFESYYRNQYERCYGYDPLEGPYEEDEAEDDTE